MSVKYPTTRTPLAQANAFPGTLNSNGSLFASPDSSITNAYRAAVLGFTPVATPTDIALIQGSASFTTRIRKIIVQGVATAAGNIPIVLIRRSTPYTTSGSAVLTAIATIGPMDSEDPAATAVVETVSTANFTSVGTAVATLATGRAQLAASGSGIGFTPLEFNFNNNSIVLRGTSDYLALNCNGAAVPAGGVLDITVEWEEDNS